MRIWPTKRTVKRLSIVAGILLGVLLLINGIFSWRVNSQFDARIAAIRAAGAPASIADLKPQPIPDEINAAAKLDALRPRLEQFSSDHSNFYSTELGRNYREDLMQPPTAEQTAAMRKILERYNDLADELHVAAACTEYASTLDYLAPFNEFQQLALDRAQEWRSIGRFLQWQAAVLAAEGDAAGSIESGLTLLRLSRLHGQEPTLTLFLVANALRGVAIQSLATGLSAGPVPDALRTELDEELAKHDSHDRFTQTLISERAYGIEAGADALRGVSRFLDWPARRHFLGAYDYYDALIQAFKQPSQNLKQSLSKQRLLSTPTGHGVLADLLAPAVEASWDAHLREVAAVRSLRILNALGNYADLHGHEATNLADLQLPAERITDPYSGTPLLIRQVGNRWIVYSAMENGQDDGGDFRDLKDYGVGPGRRGK